MSTVNCPSCNSSISVLSKRNYFFKMKKFELYHCHKCDLMFWFPLLMDYQIYKHSNVSLYTAYHADLMGSLEISSHPLDAIPIKNGSLLDVGCATGTFLKYAQKKGFTVYGVDFDEISIENAKKKGLKNVYTMSLDEFYDFANSVGLKFNIITFFDVLEHQDNPSRFIERIRDLLKDNGFILGRVPNRNRFLQRLRFELDYDFPPHHFLMWSERALRNFLERFGFKDVNVYVPEFEFRHFVWHLEKKLIGKKLAIKIKSKFFGVDEKIAKAVTENLERVTGKKGTLIRALKKIEDLIFSLPAFPLYLFFRKKGIYINFIGRK